MKRTHEKSSQPVTSPKPTTLNLQTRAFAPTSSDSYQVNRKPEDALEQSSSSSSENLLGKLISTPSDSADHPIQRKSLHRFPIQAKLNIGEPNDKYEKEADATAAKVVQQINSSPQDQSVQRQDSMEQDEIQMKPVISKIQREESMEDEDEELQMKSLVQKRENVGGGEASNDLESSIQSARGSGQSLDPNLQEKMGQAMGADFSDVKVHTDSQSDQLNKSIQAKAFTTGHDVFFRQGAYEPNSLGGQELIAHELTHVVQQKGSTVQRLVQPKKKYPNPNVEVLSKSFDKPIIQAKEEISNDKQDTSDKSHPNKTGLPTALKTGIENLSGYSMDDVKVHYNSNKPAQLQAHAYAEGSDIHVASGQDEHLPHEAWHVVQQKQGRVQSSIQMKGINVSLDSRMEKEADEMGSKASKLASLESRLPSAIQSEQSGKEFGQPLKTTQQSLSSGSVRQFKCGSGKKAKNTDMGADDLGGFELDNEEVVKYTELKARHDHYEGEEVDASHNPMIADGRKGVEQLRKGGMNDEDIKGHIKRMIPSYTNEDIQTYFFDNATPKVAYLDGDERSRYELSVSGGKLKQNGNNFDTGNMFSSGAGAGYSIFVMSPGGQLYANEHKPGLFHHSSFLAGLPTAAAGELQVNKGSLKMVTNKSGHYHPGAPQMYQAMQEFSSRGLSLSSFGLKISGIPEDNPDSRFNKTYKKAKDFCDAYE